MFTKNLWNSCRINTLSIGSQHFSTNGIYKNVSDIKGYDTEYCLPSTPSTLPFLLHTLLHGSPDLGACESNAWQAAIEQCQIMLFQNWVFGSSASTRWFFRFLHCHCILVWVTSISGVSLTCLCLTRVLRVQRKSQNCQYRPGNGKCRKYKERGVGDGDQK